MSRRPDGQARVGAARLASRALDSLGLMRKRAGASIAQTDRPDKLKRAMPPGASLATDAFSNALFRLGHGSQSPLEATQYPLTRMSDDYALLNSLYRDNWIVQNVVGVIPDDMTRKGWKLDGLAPEQVKRMERAARQTGLWSRLNEGLRWGRLYGGAAGLILVRGHENLLDRPLEPDDILPGAFQGIYILDRWCGLDPELGLAYDGRGQMVPQYYTLSGGEGNFSARIHRSRLIRFTGRELPYLERTAALYWGESEVEALYRDVVKHNNVAENMAALTFRANLDTMEVQNLDQLFSLGSAQAQQRFWNTMQAQSVLRSNFGMQLVNKGDQIRNAQYTFTGLRDVYEAMCLDLSGAARIPMTKLFGRSPAGMNATGESDLRNYYDYVDTLRESQLRPALDKLLPVLAMSALGENPPELELRFPPLWAPTPAELADIGEKKARTIRDTFQAGLITADIALGELKALAEETGQFGGISQEDISRMAGKTYQDVTALQDPLAGLGLEPSAMPTGDSLASWAEDYSANQPRDKNGRWTKGAGGEAKSNEETSSPKETSSQQEHSAKTIGQNKEPLLAEHMPTIQDTDGSELTAQPGSIVTRVHSFAGKETKSPVRIESYLIEKFGGKEGQWQHTTGDVKILKNDSVKTAEVHWFQEPSVGIVFPKVKRWREKKE